MGHSRRGRRLFPDRLILLGLASWALSGTGAWAQVPLGDEERQALQVQAEGLQRQASELQAQADQRLPQDQAACYQKLMVNACIEEAETRHRQAILEAHRLHAQGNDVLREIRTRDAAAKQSGQPSQAAVQAERERNRRQQEAQLESFAKSAADKAKLRQESAAREAASLQQQQQASQTRQEVARHKAEAHQRAEAARQKTQAYQNSLRQAEERAAKAKEKAAKQQASPGGKTSEAPSPQ